MTDLTERIRTVASQPAKASGDEGSIENPNLTDLIRADVHLAAKTALAAGGYPLRRVRIVPPGSV